MEKVKLQPDHCLLPINRLRGKKVRFDKYNNLPLADLKYTHEYDIHAV